MSFATPAKQAQSKFYSCSWVCYCVLNRNENCTEWVLKKLRVQDFISTRNTLTYDEVLPRWPFTVGDAECWNALHVQSPQHYRWGSSEHNTKPLFVTAIFSFIFLVKTQNVPEHPVLVVKSSLRQYHGMGFIIDIFKWITEWF